jgi:hypothetical protein
MTNPKTTREPVLDENCDIVIGWNEITCTSVFVPRPAEDIRASYADLVIQYTEVGRAEDAENVIKIGGCSKADLTAARVRYRDNLLQMVDNLQQQIDRMKV